MAKPAWENYRSQFVYILEPIFTLFRCLGIELYHASSPVKNRRLFFVVRVLVPLLAIGWCGFRVFYWFPVKLVLDPNTIAEGTTRLHYIIEYLNYWLYNSLIILGVFYFAKRHGLHLWQVTEDMLHHIPLEPNDLDNCRRVSVRCVFGCLIAMLLNIASKLAVQISVNQPWQHVIIKLDSALFIYSFASSALFISAGRMTSSAFDNIARQLEQKWGPLATPSTVWKYQRQFGVACRTAEELARTFGFILFATVSFIFIAFVNVSYNLLKSYQRLPQSIEMGTAHTIIPTTINKMCNMIEYMFCLWLLSHTADMIRSKALSLVPVLQHIRNDLYTRPCCSDESEEVHAFLLEVSETSPTFEVLGLFTLTKQVIISLIGTTLTYLVVLCQFSAAESTSKAYNNKTTESSN